MNRFAHMLRRWGLLALVAFAFAPGAHGVAEARRGVGGAPGSAAVFGVQVSGNHLISTLNGANVNPIMTAMISTEEPQGYSGGTGGRIAGIAAVTTAQYNSAINTWHASLSTAAKPYGAINAIRIPWNSSLWMAYTGLDPFGDASGSYYSVGNDTNGRAIYSGGPGGGLGTGPGHETAGDPTAYRTYIEQEVSRIVAAGYYVLLDLHWGTPTLVSTGQYVLPAGQSTMPGPGDYIAWQSVANQFKGNPAVMFELFNEPFGSGFGYGSNGDYFGELYYLATSIMNQTSTTGVSYPSASDPNGINGGCAMLDNFGDNSAQVFTNVGSNPRCYVIGVQALINGVRATGATNVVWAAPQNYASEFRDNGLGSGNLWLDMGLTDSLNQMGASWHAYNANVTSASFDAIQSAGFPVLGTEMGDFQDEDTYVNSLSKNRGYGTWTWNNFSTDSNIYTSGMMTGTNPYTGNGANAPTGSN